MNTEANPVMLVTGAARRVGAAIACALHAAGATVAIHYRHSASEAQALARQLNDLRAQSAFVLPGDLKEDDVPERLIATVVERCGRLDALVNNASSFYATPMGTMGRRDWDELIGSNLKGPLFLSQAAAPHLRSSGGTIVNIVDIHAERPLPRYPMYSVAKAGLAGLTRALALELAPEIRVNGISPGPIAWPDDGQFPPEERRTIIEHTLLKREGGFSDIARTARFLIFDAPYVTGQILAVDGGRSAHL